MSWSISFKGEGHEIAEQFNKQRDQSASYGMVAGELRDIEETRDLIVGLAERHVGVFGTASGHWTVFGADDPRNRFGRISLTIESYDVLRNQPEAVTNESSVNNRQTE